SQRLLADDDRRGKAFEVLHIRTCERLHETLHEAWVGFIDQPLGFGSNGVKDQRGLAGTRHASKDGELTLGDIDAHIFQIVVICADNADIFLTNHLRKFTFMFPASHTFARSRYNRSLGTQKRPATFQSQQDASEIMALLVVVVAGRCSRRCFSWLFHNRCFSGQHHACNRRSIHHSGVGDLDWVNDAVSNQVAVIQGGSVEAFTVRQLRNAGDDNSAVKACVGCNPVSLASQRASNRQDTNLGFIVELVGVLFQALSNLYQSGAAAGDNAFFDSCTSSVDCVFNAQLALIDFGFGSSANADNRDATRELGQALFELFLIPSGIGALNFAANKRAALFDGFGG